MSKYSFILLCVWFYIWSKFYLENDLEKKKKREGLPALGWASGRGPVFFPLACSSPATQQAHPSSPRAAQQRPKPRAKSQQRRRALPSPSSC